jgi:CBS domain-containing protein
MSMKSESRRVKHQILEQLTALRDEGKVQLHLLSLDARQGWQELEKRINKLESDADQQGEKLTELLKQTAHELTQSMTTFMAKHMNHTLGLRTNVRSVMTADVRICGPDDSLAQAAQLMWNGDCGAIPVIVDGQLLGVITDRDVCMATFTQGQAPSKLQVKAAMSKVMFSCAPDDSLESALSTMAAQRVRRLPVVSADAKLVGIISIADIVRCAKSLANPSVDAAVIDALSSISSRIPDKVPAAAE